MCPPEIANSNEIGGLRADSQSQQVWPKAMIALLARPQIKRDARQIVGDRARGSIAREIDRLHIGLARVAGVDAGRLGGLAAKDRQHLDSLLAARCTTQARCR